MLFVVQQSLGLPTLRCVVSLGIADAVEKVVLRVLFFSSKHRVSQCPFFKFLCHGFYFPEWPCSWRIERFIGCAVNQFIGIFTLDVGSSQIKDFYVL